MAEEEGGLRAAAVAVMRERRVREREGRCMMIAWGLTTIDHSMKKEEEISEKGCLVGLTGGLWLSWIGGHSFQVGHARSTGSSAL